MKGSNMDTHEELREIDAVEINAVSGGALPTPLQNIVDMVRCVTSGGDWSATGVSTLCSGPQG
jgi:hypothetical protein